MASGLPVVGPSAGGLKDNIIDGYNGILSVPNELESFYKGIKALIDDESKRLMMAKNARVFSETKSWKKVFEELIENYKILLEKNKREKAA